MATEIFHNDKEYKIGLTCRTRQNSEKQVRVEIFADNGRGHTSSDNHMKESIVAALILAVISFLSLQFVRVSAMIKYRV